VFGAPGRKSISGSATRSSESSMRLRAWRAIAAAALGGCASSVARSDVRTVDAAVDEGRIDSSQDIANAPDVGDASTDLPADVPRDPLLPRQIAPLSTSIVTSQRPLLRWALASGTDGAEVMLCRDRAMTTTCQVITAIGANGAPAAPLTPGVWFWRLRGLAAGAVVSGGGTVWQFTVGARSAPVNASWGTVLDVNGDGFADVACRARAARLRRACGVQWDVCPTGSTCSSGRCLSSPGTLRYAASCAIVSTDAANCGLCGNVCPAWQTCSAGACA